MIKKFLPIIIIILLAFALRTYQLTEIPPGLTHDEANHGRDSINVLDGVLLFYFPLNYGSEPLYNYVVAGNMALIGENLFALRYVNIIFSVLAIAAGYLWVNWAFGRSTAILAAALIAVSFWPLATSRQALRAGLLPFIATAGVIFFWLILRWAQKEPEKKSIGSKKVWWIVLGFAVCVAATLHTYLAARILWLIYPLFLGYLALVHRSLFRGVWKPVLAGLAGAGLLIIPMFAYVQANPEAETRLEMLDGPLQNLLAGELAPIFENVSQALQAFFRPGFGDHFLAYNIPGRPVLFAVSAIFFLIGIFVALWRWRQPAYAFLLIWLFVGILPSLVTGAEANTTRNLGALPPTYILPAIGFVALSAPLERRWGNSGRLILAGSVTVWLLSLLFVTVNDYFLRWAQLPEVRAAYQQTISQALAYVEESSADLPVVVSSVYPGAAHDPSLARLLLPDDKNNLRWIDARNALIFPNGQSTQLIIPSSTPLHPAFRPYAERIDTINLNSNDLDPTFSVYDLKIGNWSWADTDINFGNALTLVGAQWLHESVRPGETAELLTIWQVIDPTKVGPIVPPAYETNVDLFTHVVDESGKIVAQRDSIEAPSWGWQSGDIILQIHPITLPEDVEAGSYQTMVGIYDRTSGERLPQLNRFGEIVDSNAGVVPLVVNEQ
jgi:4-amino-4-deoxy-L-arabinose transferase-like glycosyltransferase